MCCIFTQNVNATIILRAVNGADGKFRYLVDQVYSTVPALQVLNRACAELNKLQLKVVGSQTGQRLPEIT